MLIATSKKEQSIYYASLFLVALFLTFLFASHSTQIVTAAEVPPLDEAQRGAISQHCATTKQALRTLQRTDARSRSYLGSVYENLLSDFIAPLNLLLINSNQPNTNLTTIHSEIIETRKTFIAEYTTYSQYLEDLLAIDCQSHPDEFYKQLVETREKRAALSTTTTHLRNLFSEHITAVKRLRSSLIPQEGANSESQN